MSYPNRATHNVDNAEQANISPGAPAKTARADPNHIPAIAIPLPIDML